MKVLCVIPARGGSKRLPGKNIRCIAGKPLIAYTIEKALESKLCARVVVSTDDDQISYIAGKYGAEVIERPEKFSRDSSPIDDALRHAFEVMKGEGFEADVIVSLQANTPVRKTGEIDELVEALGKDGNATAIATAYEIDQRPEWMKVVDDSTGYAKPLMPPTQDFRAQLLPKRYLIDGSGMAIRPDVLMSARGNKIIHAYLGNNVKLCVHDKKYAVEIDEDGDFEIAEYFLEKENN